ncbi:MAG: hypothetical protein II882_03575 [Lachnospiraceae bacterium]|nr:hypothetical protein [Lachnospiraceae bacterium]
MKKQSGKKMICFLLSFSLLFGILPGPKALAKMEPEKPEAILGEFEYRMMGSSAIQTMEGMLFDNEKIYVRAEDGAALAGFTAGKLNDGWEFYREGEEIWTLLDLRISEEGLSSHMDFQIPTYKDKEGNRWYSLIYLLYFLRASFYIDDKSGQDVLVVLPAEAMDLMSTLEDFSGYLENVRLSKQRLNIQYGGIGTTAQVTLGMIINDGFDPRILLGMWGADWMDYDQYKKALYTLAASDQEYLLDVSGKAVEEELGFFNYQWTPAWVSEMSDLIQFPNNAFELADILEKLDEATWKAMIVRLPLLNAPQETGFTLSRLIKDADKVGEYIGVGADMYMAGINLYEVYYRSQDLQENMVEGLGLLADADLEPFSSSKESVKRIKKAAESVIGEANNPFAAAAFAYTVDMAKIVAKVLISHSPVGPFVAVLGLGFTVADMLAYDWMDTGEQTYMVKCLMDIETVSKTCYDIAYSHARKEIAEQGFASQETLDELRAWAIFDLKINLRNIAYIFSMNKNADPDFVNSETAEQMQRVMLNDMFQICFIESSDRYDEQLSARTEGKETGIEAGKVREEFGESIWRTCYIGGLVYDEETKEPVSGAEIKVYRGKDTETPFAVASTNADGEWELKLDNRYDYTFTFNAKDQDGQDYMECSEWAEESFINEKENYVYFRTSMTKDLAELFYKYLRSKVVPKIGVCDGADFVTELENKDIRKGSGLLSALVDDLDKDGSPEMVTVTITEQDIAGTVGSLVFPSGSCVAANLDLYELVDGEVVHADGPVTAAVMEEVSFGSVDIVAYQWDKVTYFAGYSHMDDNTTYGPSQTALFHPEDGKLVFDYVAGGSWGQALPRADANEIMHTRDMDIRHTIFSLGGDYREEICHLIFDRVQYENVHIQMEDATWLAEALEDGYVAIRERAKEKLARIDKKERLAKAEVEEELRKLEEAENEPAVKAARAEIDYLSKTTGYSFAMERENLSDDGSYQILYTAPGHDNAQLSIHTDPAGAIVYIETTAGTWTQTAEWIAIKDAILNSPLLGLSAGIITELSGNLNTQSLQKDADGYSFLVINIDNYTIRITKN